ncbi:histidine kinase [Ekhidna sp.]|uniref:sensor histidine kinase n=1 Tax=Ekhidna sp. TaxID=2608089 RepID=UPI003B50D7DC
MRRITCFLILQLLLDSLVFGQLSLSNAVNYTIKDGLPSNTVYAVIQDDQGFIWFGTDAGLSRFDGLEFKNYGLKEGLPDMDILNFFKDSQGRIWMYTFNGKVCYLKDGRILNSSNDPFLAGADLESRLTSIVEDENEIFISSLWEGVKILNPNKRIKTLSSENDKNYLVIINNKCYWLLINSTSIKYYLVSDLISNLDSDSIEFQELSNRKGFANFSYVNVFKDEIFGVSRGTNSTHQFFKINLDQQLFHIQSVHDYVVYNIEAIRDRVFLYTSDGIKLIDPENLTTSDFIDLEEVTKFIYDFDDNIWFSTLKSGAFFIPNQPVKKKYPVQIRNVEKLYSTPNYLYIAYRNRLIARTNQFLKDELENISTLELSYIKSFYVDPLQNMWVLSSSSLLKNEKPSTSGFTVDLFYSLLKDSEFIYHSFDELIYTNLKNDELYNFDYENVGKIWDFILFDHSILLAGSNGLFSLNLSDLTVKRFPEFDQIRVTSIALDKFDKLWLVTNGNGLLRLPKQLIFTIPSNEISGYRIENYSDVFNKVLLIDSTLYSSTPKGISKFIFNKEEVVETTHITESHGLEPARVVDVVYYSGDVYMGQDNGLFSFKHSENFNDTIRFPVIVDELRTSDTVINTLDKDITFPYDVGIIQVNTKTIYFKDHNNLSYQFKLYNQNESAESWTTSPNNEFLFSNLEPGNYTFEVRVKSLNSDWTEPSSISFSIENVFWRTLWFKILIASILLFSITLATNSISRSRKRKQLLSRQKIESDLKALKAQINPHFLFNSLNSIHSYILEKENDLAEDYLLKYGKLMRNILNHSNELSIRMDDELEAIKLYIELEKIRINKPIDFQVDTSKIDVTEHKVPSMIIQPLLENAIWHGIQPSAKEGKILLKFEQKDDVVKVEIHDNGTGFQDQNFDDRPSGLQLVKERIELINQLKGRKSSFKIDSDETGTKIIFDYPNELT